MYKSIGLLFVLLVNCFIGKTGTHAQVPDFIKNTSPSRNTTFAWGGGISSKKVQMLYLPSDFEPDIPNGVITELYFMYGNSSGSGAENKYKNLSIKLGQTTDTVFPATKIFYTNLTPVLTEADYSINGGLPGDWFKVKLNNTFVYNNNQSLIVEISFDTCINLVNSSGLGCYSGTAITGRKLYTPYNQSTIGISHTSLLNMGITFREPLCSGNPYAGNTIAANTKIPCGSTTTLSLDVASGLYGLSYQWQYNDNGSWVNFGSNFATQTTKPLISNTQFRCVVSCLYGGEGISVPVTVLADPINVQLGNDTVICPGITFRLDAGINGASYSWSTGDVAKNITINASGSYWVSVTLPNGCNNTDTINLRTGILPVNVLPSTTNLCEGETIQLDAGNPGCTFMWEKYNLTTRTITVKNGGLYSVMIKSPDGCVINSKTEVKKRPLPMPILTSDTGICEGDTLLLKGGNPGCRFLWNTQDTTSNLSVTDTGNYSVTITTPYGCKRYETLNVYLQLQPYVEDIQAILIDEKEARVKFKPLHPEYYSYLEWDFGDGSPKSSDVYPEHVYLKSGTYIVSLTLYNPCDTYTHSIALTVEVSVGLPDVDGYDKDIWIYPNPARSHIYIRSNIQDLVLKHILVYDMLGKPVISTDAKQLLFEPLQINSLPSGVFTMKVYTDKGWIIRKLQVVK